MDHALRDPIWQFVGVIISVFALVVAIAAIRFQQQRKAIGYHCTSDRPVFYLFNKALRERLVVMLDGSPVTGLSTREVCFFNYGNTPVSPSDYVERLAVTFPEHVKVLGVAVTETNPEGIEISVESIDRQFRIEPALLNPGDEFVLQFLIEHPERERNNYPSITGRISGVKRLEHRISRPAAKYRLEYYTFRAIRALPYFILGAVSGTSASAIYDFFSNLAK